MTDAADATPSSPQRISNTTGAHVMNAKTTSDMKSGTSRSSRPTGDGAQSATACVGCGISLKTFEVFACTDCLNFWLMSDPNGLMGDDDEIT